MSNIPIYYINLDRRPQRKEALEGLAKEQNIKIERFPGYDGMKDAEPRNKNLKRGHFGCWMSHLGVWDTIAKSGKLGIVLEDDIVFDNNFMDKLNAILSDSSYMTYDILLLGHNWCTNKDPITKRICSIGLYYGCQGYIITPKCAKYLCDKYNKVEEILQPLDVELGEINVSGDIKVLAAKDRIVILGDFSKGSDTNRK